MTTRYDIPLWKIVECTSRNPVNVSAKTKDRDWLSLFIQVWVLHKLYRQNNRLILLQYLPYRSAKRWMQQNVKILGGGFPVQECIVEGRAKNYLVTLTISLSGGASNIRQCAKPLPI